MAPKSPIGQAELLPRYALLAPLVKGRRVLEIGAVRATEGLSAHFLVNRGAEHVVACDDDGGALVRAEKTLGGPKISFRGPDFEALAPESFDLVLVSDFSLLPKDDTVLERVMGLVSPRGVFVGGLRNSKAQAFAGRVDTHGLDRIVGRVSMRFPSVQVVRQRVALCFQLVSDADAAAQVDDSMSGTGEPVYFVVLAGLEAVRLPGKTWFPVPDVLLESGYSRYVPTTQAVDPEQVRRLQAELHEARIELVNRQAEVHERSLKAEKERQRTEGTSVERQREEHTQLLASSHEQLRHVIEELDTARAELGSREEQARALSAELQAIQGAQSKTEAELAAARVEIAQRTDLVDQLSAALEDSNRRQSQLTGELEEARAREQALGRELEGVTSRCRMLERQGEEAAALHELSRARVSELELNLAQGEASLASEAQRLEQTQGALTAAELSREKERRQLVDAQAAFDSARAEAENLGRQFQAIHRELTSALGEKEELERRLNTERLERQRLERALSTRSQARGQ